MHAGRFALIFAVSLAAALLPSSPAAAAVISPTVFTDDLTDNGNCTLREAIHAANNDVAKDACPQGNGADTIQLKPGTYALTVPSTDEDAGANGDLDVNQDLTITGDGAGQTTVDGDWTAMPDRIFGVHGVGTEFTVRGMTIRDGNLGGTSGAGGGIQNEVDTTLTLSDVDLIANRAGYGGGIDHYGAATLNRVRLIANVGDASGGSGCCGAWYNNSDATVTMTDVVIHGNTAVSDSGAMYSTGDLATLTNVTFSDNHAGTVGGAINFSNGDATLTNVTFSNNTAGGHGGAIRHAGDATTLNNVTITGNTADQDAGGDPGDGGGIYNSSGTITIRNSIIAGNTDRSGEAPDCGQGMGDEVTSGGHNILGSTTGCTFPAGAGDLQNVDPKLGPLADNGGFTMTHALLPGSPAINAAGADAAPTDQRGLPRNPDIGAYELVLCKKVPINRIGTAGNDLLTGTSGADGFLAQDGNDRAKGLGGNDAACMGGGKDTA
ncbi:MAG: choice-of-anchor Q domain-containing protein, partial [Actinomycetota bacterium]